MNILFDPISIKSLTLKNRIVMAPMTRSFSPNGVPGENVAEYYRKRAEGDVGLILSEGVAINRPAAKNDPNVPNFYGEEALTGWQHVINQVHQNQGKMGPQLWHVGSVRSSIKGYKSPQPTDSPSGISSPGKVFGEPSTDEVLQEIITAFAKAAGDAKRLGFDTLEIHAAHGYLVDQFFWAETNARTDNFGGSTIKERNQFAVEVIKAMRIEVGPDFPIIIRLSQWKQQDYAAKIAQSPDEMTDWLLPLAEAGIDIFHCSQRRFWEPEFPEIDGEKGLNFAGWAKKITGVKTISVGSVGLNGEFVASFKGEGAKAASLGNLIDRMEREEFDMIAVGRAILNDPLWVKKVSGEIEEPFLDFSAKALQSLI